MAKCNKYWGYVGLGVLAAAATGALAAFKVKQKHGKSRCELEEEFDDFAESSSEDFKEWDEGTAEPAAEDTSAEEETAEEETCPDTEAAPEEETAESEEEPAAEDAPATEDNAEEETASEESTETNAEEE